MLFLIIFLAIGIGLGLSIRKIAELTKTSEKVLTFLYYPCLFLLAVILHLDEKVVLNVDEIGWHSFVHMIIGFAVVIVLVWSIYKLLKLLIKLGFTHFK